jgi:hypothetical protein
MDQSKTDKHSHRWRFSGSFVFSLDSRRRICLFTGISKTLESMKDSKREQKCKEHDVPRALIQLNSLNLMTFPVLLCLEFRSFYNETGQKTLSCQTTCRCRFTWHVSLCVCMCINITRQRGPNYLTAIYMSKLAIWKVWNFRWTASEHVSELQINKWLPGLYTGETW